jgi:hypothetical protein
VPGAGPPLQALVQVLRRLQSIHEGGGVPQVTICLRSQYASGHNIVHKWLVTSSMRHNQAAWTQASTMTGSHFSSRHVLLTVRCLCQLLEISCDAIANSMISPKTFHSPIDAESLLSTLTTQTLYSSGCLQIPPRGPQTGNS